MSSSGQPKADSRQQVIKAIRGTRDILPPDVALWQQVGARSLYIVPLVAGDRTIACLTLVDVKSGNRFTPEMRTLAQRFPKDPHGQKATARVAGDL